MLFNKIPLANTCSAAYTAIKLVEMQAACGLQKALAIENTDVCHFGVKHDGLHFCFKLRARDVRNILRNRMVSVSRGISVSTACDLQHVAAWESSDSSFVFVGLTVAATSASHNCVACSKRLWLEKYCAATW